MKLKDIMAAFIARHYCHLQKRKNFPFHKVGKVILLKIFKKMERVYGAAYRGIKEDHVA
jgi:hypothetical protein